MYTYMQLTDKMVLTQLGCTCHHPPAFLSSLAATGMTDPEESPQSEGDETKGPRRDDTSFEQRHHHVLHIYIYIIYISVFKYVHHIYIYMYIHVYICIERERYIICMYMIVYVCACVCKIYAYNRS